MLLLCSVTAAVLSDRVVIVLSTWCLLCCNFSTYLSFALMSLHCGAVYQKRAPVGSCHMKASAHEKQCSRGVCNVEECNLYT